jgi:Domain of unknown function (DUF3480)
MGSKGLLDRVPIADGDATVRLYTHEVDRPPDEPVPCWSYVSEGLEAFGQREIMLTLVRAPGEDLPPGDPIELLELIVGAAQEGKLVDRGGLSGFGPRGFLANPELRGLVYAPAQHLADVDVPPNALAAVALFGDEFEAVQRYGALRVLARLGQTARFYPYPPWCERAREPLAGAFESILENVASLNLPDASVTLDGETAFVRLLPSYKHVFAEAFKSFPEERALALLVSLEPNAPACLVWSPGQSSHQAISTPEFNGNSFGACYLGLVPQQDADAARIFEDGLMVLLTDASWAALRRALADGAPFRLERGQGAYGLVIEWLPNDALNPSQS